jgi:ATP-binding cassette subfamily B protein
VRRAIGYVAQEPFLTDGSVLDNIAYGMGSVARDSIEAAARAAEAHDFIALLPQGYDTEVGERGIKLSGGQRQRLALARAILKDPPILVLDEATSAVDNETEAAIQRSLQRLVVGRTTLIIAHRLSTIRHADCIHVVDGGHIVESGTHEELLARNGSYAALWRLQTGQQWDERRYER